MLGIVKRERVAVKQEGKQQMRERVEEEEEEALDCFVMAKEEEGYATEEIEEEEEEELARIPRELNAQIKHLTQCVVRRSREEEGEQEEEVEQETSGTVLKKESAETQYRRTTLEEVEGVGDLLLLHDAAEEEEACVRDLESSLVRSAGTAAKMIGERRSVVVKDNKPVKVLVCNDDVKPEFLVPIPLKKQKVTVVDSTRTFLTPERVQAEDQSGSRFYFSPLVPQAKADLKKGGNDSRMGGVANEVDDEMESLMESLTSTNVDEQSDEGEEASVDLSVDDNTCRGCFMDTRACVCSSPPKDRWKVGPETPFKNIKPRPKVKYTYSKKGIKRPSSTPNEVSLGKDETKTAWEESPIEKDNGDKNFEFKVPVKPERKTVAGQQQCMEAPGVLVKAKNPPNFKKVLMEGSRTDSIPATNLEGQRDSAVSSPTEEAIGSSTSDRVQKLSHTTEIPQTKNPPMPRGEYLKQTPVSAPSTVTATPRATTADHNRGSYSEERAKTCLMDLTPRSQTDQSKEINIDELMFQTPSSSSSLKLKTLLDEVARKENSIEERKAPLKAKLSPLTKELIPLRKKLSELETRRRELEGEATPLAKQLKDLHEEERSVSKFRKQVESIAKKMEAIEETIAKGRSKRRKLDSAIAHAESMKLGLFKKLHEFTPKASHTV
eukprot:Nk52_evm24s2356 gene=Nk52_evmTU24s2356